MELWILLVVVIAVVVYLALTWRPPRAPRRTADEALASDALAKEQDAQRTESIYLADRYNVPGGNRKY